MNLITKHRSRKRIPVHEFRRPNRGPHLPGYMPRRSGRVTEGPREKPVGE